MFLRLLVFAAAVPAWGLLLLQRTPCSRSAGPFQPRLACAVMKEATEMLTFTLTGCSAGIGLGLDAENRIDMLAPGKPASASLQMGDKVISWNGIDMVDSAGERKMLKDVVVPADSHELVIERVRSATPLSTDDWESGLTCVEYVDGAANELRLGVFVAYTQVCSAPT